MLDKCFAHHWERPSFNQLFCFGFFHDTVILNNNNNCDLVKLKIVQAARIVQLLKNSKPRILRKIWVESVHRPVHYCVHLYYKREFENFLKKYSSDLTGYLVKTLEQKILQFSSPMDDIRCVEHLIHLYEDHEITDENDIELLEVLKATLDSFNNPN